MDLKTLLETIPGDLGFYVMYINCILDTWTIEEVSEDKNKYKIQKLDSDLYSLSIVG